MRFAQGVVAAVLAAVVVAVVVSGFAYCVEVLFSPSPLVLALVVLAVLVGMAYTAKKWD